MTLTGHIVGGQIILDAPASLPDGTAVRIETVSPPPSEPVDGDDAQLSVPLSERLKNFLSHVVDLPEDAALNHDHYLYGAPKK